MSKIVRDCVVIGGGVAGCTAALYARRYNLDVLILDSLGGGGNIALASKVENYPGFPGGITGAELAERVRQQALEVGAEFRLTTAERLERTEDGLWRIIAGEEQILTRTVILAMGAFPRSLQVPGEKELRGRGVSYCATCDGFFYRGKIVAVVGGGNAAADEALYLADLAQKVYLIHRRDRLRADAYMQEKLFANPRIEILWNTIVTRIQGEESVTGLELENVQTHERSALAVDGVFIAIGHIAKTEWLEGLVEREDGFIRTDELMRTNQPGIFAAGDVRVTPLRQITTAVGDATIAAYSAYQYIQQNR